MARPLDQYAAKRTFSRTPEPAPRIVTRAGPLLFVVQKHAARQLHYDFRLELDGVLKSWAVPKGPSLELGEKRLAVETEDHPFDYASFEGVIPAKEYGAGNVIVWDCGLYSPDEGQRYSFDHRAEAEARVRAELAAGKLSFFLRGEKLKGSFALVKTSSSKQWLLIKHKDRFANQADVLARAGSVLSGNTLHDLASQDPSTVDHWTRDRSTPAASTRMDAEKLAATGPAEPLPKKLSPMLAEIGRRIQSDPQWLYEPKLDGYRVIASVSNGEVRLTSRRGIDLTPAFPEVVADLAAQAVDTLIVDGEIVALAADGKPSFNALQNRAQLKTPREVAEGQRTSPVALVCFDLLHFAGMNLRAAPYADRRRYLAQCLLTTAHLQLTHVSADAEKLYAAAMASGFEGIVGKRKDSPYQPGKRSTNWIKFKAEQTQEFVVGGFTKGKGEREPLGALLLGFYRGGKLHYAGHAGSGLTEALVSQFRKRFENETRRASPFVEKPPLHRPTTWLNPTMVVEVTFTDWTPDGMLRAPVFKRVRDDIEPKKVQAGPETADADLHGEAPEEAASDDAASDAAAPASKAARGRRSCAAVRPANTSASLATPHDERDSIIQQLAVKSTQLTLEVQGARLKLTNLDRVYWPEDKAHGHHAVTKRDFIRYLASVSPYMLPHLQDRPLTMIRMPAGITGERFYQKHWEQARPDFVETITVYSEHVGESHDYILANNLPTLLWLGQNGTLEFHVWHSRAKVEPDAITKATDYSTSVASLEASVLNYPDFLVFDLDPYIYSGHEAKGAEPELNKKGFAVGKKVAFWLRDLLREMSLEPKVKTSGKTGLHVFVPIERTVTFDEARKICEMVGRHLVRAHPRDITMEWATQKRTGKIFYDYNMNVRGKTLNVAYSPRGVLGAPVSMPLTWEELEAAEPMDFRVGNVLARLEKARDRWHDVLSSKQSLTKAFGSSARSDGGSNGGQAR